MKFKIYADGGCSGNKRGAGCPGAYAYIVLDSGNNVIYKSGARVENTTNNRMELMGVIEGLKCLYGYTTNYTIKPECSVITDSKYVVDNFNDYMTIWIKNGWRKSGGGIVINSDLWKRLHEHSEVFLPFKISWVKGHSSNLYNRSADELVRYYLYNERASEHE